jgi:hypothetical protein
MDPGLVVQQDRLLFRDADLRPVLVVDVVVDGDHGVQAVVAPVELDQDEHAVGSRVPQCVQERGAAERRDGMPPEHEHGADRREAHPEHEVAA